jgi:RND family efflux transporter MFP subunit
MSAIMNNESTLELQPEPASHSRAGSQGYTVNHNPAHSPSADQGIHAPARPPGPAHKRRGGGRALLIAIAAAVAIVLLLLWQRSRTFHQLAAATDAMAVPTVSTVLPKAGPGQVEIKLPGNLMAYTEASIYARTNGYVKAWYTDIGAQVKMGQLMAELEAPDVDAQLRQSRADLSQAEATLDIDQLNYNRAVDLLNTKVISQEEYDTRRTTLEAQQAMVRAAQANVQNLAVEQGFQKITAPFNGVVTRRDTDVGALINAGSDPTSYNGAELFQLARTDILRVYISIPEIYSPMVKLDTPAWLELAEAPGEKFQGKVADIAGAIDPTTRTLQTEVQVPNGDGRLYPGAYAIVHLVLKLDHQPIIIPINTVLFRSQGNQVGVVDGSDIVHLRSITVGRDFGTSYEVTSGVAPTDRLVLNPSDSLADGTKVRVEEGPSTNSAR